MCHQGALLADFIHAIAAKDPERERSELVINGDFIDFLAERPVDAPEDDPDRRRWTAFHDNPEHARDVFHRIAGSPDKPAAGREAAVFDALNRLVTRGHRLTVLLGNHDIELAQPLVHAAFLDRIGAGPGRRVDVEMILDNRAYVVGDVIIEHGNQADEWNRVDYDGLRALCAWQSRGMPECASFEPPAGSRLVADVINDLKAELPFVDLLKPEGRAVAPVLLALKPSALGKLRAALGPIGKALTSKLTTRHGYEIARDGDDRSSGRGRGRGRDPIVEAIRDTLPADDASELVAILFGPDARGEIAGGVSTIELWLAFRLLRWLYRDEVFDVSRESGKPYRKAAQARASRTIHDALFKRVFGDATNAAAELRTVVPAQVARHIDWSSLTVAHANVVSERFTQRYGDLIFSARLTDGREAFVWLLFEHQSTVDPWMAVRVAELTLDLWKRWRERNPRARRVPAVLPVVLYHGASPWSAATSLAALTDLSPAAAADWGDHLLSCRFVLDDLRATPHDALAARQLPPYPKLGLVVFKHGPDPALPARLGRYSAELRALLATEDGTALLGVLLEYTWYVNAHVDRDVLIRHL